MTARRIALALLILLLAGAAAMWWYVESRRSQLELGVGYAARVACGCRFAGHRPLASCYKDFEPGMEVISLSESGQSVTAYVPLVASRRVSFDPVLGCQAEPYRGALYPVKNRPPSRQ